MSDSAPKTGIAAIFKRAAEAQQAKNAAGPPPVREGMELRQCSTCGAPRRDESLRCHYCGGNL
ncbi:MAG TPA: hypothetical protein VM925_35715 [Labilithrix sp.]|nr:hypothetical protein [Labilithrix sp.]